MCCYKAPKAGMDTEDPPYAKSAAVPQEAPKHNGTYELRKVGAKSVDSE